MKGVYRQLGKAKARTEIRIARCPIARYRKKLSQKVIQFIAECIARAYTDEIKAIAKGRK
jgi:hypothetical protein